MSAQHDTTARIAGLLVFLAGIGLLLSVFVSAHALFNAPAPPLPATAGGAAGSAAPSAAAEIGRSFSQLGRQIILLLLMCIAGSVVASKGIQLYFAARPADVTPPANEPAPKPVPGPTKTDRP